MERKRLTRQLISARLEQGPDHEFAARQLSPFTLGEKIFDGGTMRERTPSANFLYAGCEATPAH
jgi:hypothetical protein